MTYDSLEGSTAGGRPYFLYLFTEGETLWRFTSRVSDWESPAGAADASGEVQTWTAKAISHGDITLSRDPERVDVDLTFPLSDSFARRFLGAREGLRTTLTIYRGHEQVPEETVVHWKGEVVGTKFAGEQLVLACASLQRMMQRSGLRHVYSRICRHTLYLGSCGLDIEDHFTESTATARDGLTVTVAAAGDEDDGWYRGGVLRHNGLLSYIRAHTGSSLTLMGRLADLEAAIDAEENPTVEIAPGCDLRRNTCKDKYGNLLNFGGFVEIPGRNPFDGAALI